MLLRKLKTLIYIIIFVFSLNFILPVYSFAIDKDSLYVWSDISSSVSTSNTPEAVEEPEINTNQDNSR